MRKLIITFIALGLALVSWAINPQTLTFKSSKNHLKVENVSNNGFTFELSIAEAFLKDAESKEGDFFILQTSGFTKSNNIGAPDLPSKSKLIQVPFGANVNVEIVSSSYEVIDLSNFDVNALLFPAQPSVAKCDDGKQHKFHLNKEIYNQNKFFGNKIANYRESGIMRGTRLGTIEINPFQYNPQTNELLVYTNVNVKVTFENADFSKTQQMSEIYGNSFYNSLLTKTMNYQANDKPLNQSEPVKMIIIADRMFEGTLVPFIEWKTMTGIETLVRYTDETEVGSTTTSIKAYLQGVYEAATTENPAPTFVLFVGDVQQIPAFAGTAGSHVSDLYYCTYDGASDLIPDVNYGRFSAQNVEQLQNILDKTLLYEKYEMADPSYLENAVLVAGVDGSYATVYGNGAINYMNIYLNEENDVNAYMYHYPASGSSGAAIIQNVSDGVALGNYTAHCGSSGWGDPSFTTSDIPGLQNAEKYGLLIGNCCLSNKFDDNECFGEALLRTADKGAIGYIGGSNSTYWDEDYYWATGYGTAVQNPNYEDFGNGSYDLLYHQNISDQPYSDWAPTQSQVNLAGQLAVEESNSSRKTYYWEIYHLMGDPTLMPWVGVPAAITPNYYTTIPIGVNSLDISGLPEYARIALSDEGILIATTLADASGSATLEFEGFTNPTTAELVVTAQFHQPYIGELDIIPGTEPFVVLNEYEIIGDAIFGEEISLSINLKNVAETESGYDAANVEATLTSTDEYITITDAAESYGTIDAGDSTTIDNGFTLSIENNIPDQHMATFTLTVSGIDAKYTWISNFNIKIDAPQLAIGALSIDDSGEGNGDGVLDPGETANLVLALSNTGHADLTDVTSSLSILSGDEFLTLNNTETTIGTLAFGTNSQGVFEVTANAATPLGTNVSLENSVAGGIEDQYNAIENKDIIIGFIPEYCESGATNSGDTEIQEVSFGDVVNNTAGECGTYSDFTEDPTLTAEFMIGSTQTIGVFLGNCDDGSYTKAGKVYIDWNYDGDFEDEGEMVFATEIQNANWLAEGSFIVPATASTGQKFMRIVISEDETNITPCGSYSYGETEDYKIFLVAPEAPVVNFTASPTTTTVGMNVSFTDLTTNAPYEWSWDITPGTENVDFEYIQETTSGSKNPIVKFNTANQYSISLSATNMIDTDTETKADYIAINEVTEVPVANFAADQTTIYPGETVQLTDLSNNSPNEWTWTITPGVVGTDFEFIESTDANSQNPSIQFNNAGYYSIELIASNEIGNSEPTTMQDMINVLAVYMMQNGIITTCSGTFFDEGGPDANYNSSSNLTLTLYPAEAGKMSRVDFTEFSTEDMSSGGCYDGLSIYDGESSSATLIDTYCDNNPATTAIATNSAGALTFVFTSDGSVTQDGWVAEISCVTQGNYLATFIVSDQESNPIIGASILINENTLTTGVSGSASIDLPNGSYDYTISANGYSQEEGVLIINDADITENVTLNQIEYMVTFNVTANGSPVEGAEIVCPSGTMSTDITGAAAMGMPSGTHSFTITKDDYQTYSDVVEVTNEPVTVNVSLLNIGLISTSNFKLYPNPNNGNFKIEVNGTYEITIMNALGEVIQNKEINNRGLINMEDAAEGIYFIRLNNGINVETQRFIITK